MRFYLPDSQRKPDPALRKVNAPLAIYVGIAAWVVGLVALFASEPAEPLWWYGCCLTGILLGILMLVYLRRRR